MMPAAMMESISLWSIFRSNSVIGLCYSFRLRAARLWNGTASDYLRFWRMVVLEDFLYAENRANGRLEIFLRNFSENLTEPVVVL